MSQTIELAKSLISKASDTPDKIEYDALAKRAQLAFTLAWEIANRPEKIKVDRDGK